MRGPLPRMPVGGSTSEFTDSAVRRFWQLMTMSLPACTQAGVGGDTMGREKQARTRPILQKMRKCANQCKKKFIFLSKEVGCTLRNEIAHIYQIGKVRIPSKGKGVSQDPYGLRGSLRGQKTCLWGPPAGTGSGQGSDQVPKKAKLQKCPKSGKKLIKHQTTRLIEKAQPIFDLWNLKINGHVQAHTRAHTR